MPGLRLGDRANPGPGEKAVPLPVRSSCEVRLHVCLWFGYAAGQFASVAVIFIDLPSRTTLSSTVSPGFLFWSRYVASCSMPVTSWPSAETITSPPAGGAAVGSELSAALCDANAPLRPADSAGPPDATTVT